MHECGLALLAWLLGLEAQRQGQPCKAGTRTPGGWQEGECVGGGNQVGADTLGQILASAPGVPNLAPRSCTTSFSETALSSPI